MFVRLTADPKGITAGTRQAETALTRFARGAVANVTTAIAGMFAARSAIRFGSDVVHSFAEAEAIWERLATAVDATGSSFDSLAPSIESAAKEMQAATRFGDEEFAAALQGLVVQTGDVQKSMRLMGLAADLAAAKQISLESATELLGRAMAGNTTALTRMFPALKSSTDVFGDLQKIVQGMAQRDAQTLEGRLVQLNNAWGDFKEALGGALVGSEDMKGAVGALTGIVQASTRFISENRDAIEGVGLALGGAARLVGLAIAGWVQLAGVLRPVATVLANILDKLHGIQRTTIEPPAALTRARMGEHLALPELPAIKGTSAEVDKISAAWRNLADDVRVADEMFQLLGGRQDFMNTKLAATSGTLQELLRLGVDPMSDGIQKLVGQIKTLNALMEQVEKREFKVSAIATFKLEPITPPAGTGGGATENALGPIGQLFENILGELTGAFDALLASLGPMAIVGEFLNGVFAALAPVIEALMVPIRNIGFLVGSVLTPILKLLQPVLNTVAKVFSFVIQAIGEFIKGLGKAINFLLPGNPANGLVKFGQNMIDMAKQTRDAIDAGTDLTKTLEKVNASASNVPQIFDLIARRRAAGSDLKVPSGGTAQARGGVTVNVNNPPAGVDPKHIARQVLNAITDLRRRGGVSAFDVAVAGAE